MNCEFIIVNMLKSVLPTCLVILLTSNVLAESPREKLLLDFGWKFHLGDAPDAKRQFDYPEVSDLAKTRIDEIGREGDSSECSDYDSNNLGGSVSFVQSSFDDSSWRELDLPHDWAVELPFDRSADMMHGFKPVGNDFKQNNIGWYRREFDLPADDKGKILWLEFDGVYRNSLVWLNGHCLGRHLSGYCSFRYEISRYVNFGGKNELVVRVDASRFEGWFYEGAGIYRHVWLEKTSMLAIPPDGVFICSELSNNLALALVRVSTMVTNSENTPNFAEVSWAVYTPNGKFIEASNAHEDCAVEVDSKTTLSHDFELNSPQLWSPESPNLYKLVIRVNCRGSIVDQEEIEFGIRSIAFDPARGFLLNGKPYFIKGTCEHQDHAGVGTAVPDALQYFRIRKLKEMGCNAIRTAHNPPSPELLEACDRLGMLVMDENRRMDLTVNELGDLRSLILRDRNHPSVFLWSLGNEEIYLQGRKSSRVTTTQAHETAIRVTTVMQNLVHELDPTRLCTVAMNGGIGDGISKVIDVQGWNYTWSGDPDHFHRQHPNTREIATETASTYSARGVYENDEERGYLSAFDVNTTHYLLVDGVRSNLTAEGWWKYYSARPFISGVFNWTGFDYRGEPVPFKWPSVSSYFGCLDTCGFPKDNFYYYQSQWTQKPMLHLFPHWNWPDKIGQLINVWCYSNCKKVELFLNGRSLGEKTMPSCGHLEWNVKYTPGVLAAIGYEGGKNVVETAVETTGKPAAIILAPDRPILNADGEDCCVVNVSVVDVRGRVVPLADNLIHFKIGGAGRIIGVGNGDPVSHESDKSNERKVFNGLAQVIVQSKRQSGMIELMAFSPGLRTASTAINSQAGIATAVVQGD